MSLELRQKQRQTQKLLMTVTLPQAIQLLPLSRLELQQRVQQEMMENPLLEEVQTSEVPEGEILDPDLALATSFGDTLDLGYYEEDLPERPSPKATLSRETSLSDHLDWQLSLSTADELRVLRAWIHEDLAHQFPDRLPLDLSTLSAPV